MFLSKVLTWVGKVDFFSQRIASARVKVRFTKPISASKKS